MRGRPPQSLDNLKLHGAYRPDRHGSREASEPLVDGLPEKPEGLSKDAEWMWDLVISEYGNAGPVRRLDTAILLYACQLWALLQQAGKAAELAPLDKDTRIAFTNYGAAWDRAAAKLGLTPRDRRSVRTENSPAKSGVRTRGRA